MKYLSRTAMACFCLLLAGNGINACELPAHPNAAAMPVSITTRGGTETSIKAAGDKVKLVSDGSNGSFYYLIPEGSKVKMKIVWDPLCHNSGATGKDWEYKKEQYDYLNDGHIDGVEPDKEVQAAGGYSFFPLEAMSKFFEVSGNRNDIEEAFGREMGVSTENNMIPDSAGLGPASLYSSAFSKASTELVIKLTGVKCGENKDEYSDKAVLYKDTYAARPVLEEYDKAESLNSALPGKHMNLNQGKVYLLENDKLKLQKFDNGNVGFSATKVENSEDLMVYSDSGLEVRNASISLKKPVYKDYKAYIAKNSNDKEIHVEGIDYNSENPIATGENEGYFNVTFTTPTIAGNGNEDDAILKIRVNSPAAGYEMSNVYWIWKEQYYERVKEDKEYPVEGEDGVEKLNCSDDSVIVYKKKDGLKKCSCETLVTFNKAQDAFGYSGYKIYDDCGPVSTKLELVKGVNENLSFAESEGKAEKTTFKYKISLIDSNPFLDKEITATTDEKNDFKDISQNKDRMEVTFYYNYPVYKYKDKTINSIDDLKMKGCGLVDFIDTNKSVASADFRTYDYDVQWYWKKAVDVKVDSLKNDEIYEDIVSKRIIGSKSTIEGTFTIDNPKPWHVSENYPEIKSDIDSFTNFAVFAVLKDTAGNTHLTEVYNANKTDTELPSANPENLKDKKFAVYPNENNAKIITANLEGKTAPALPNSLKDKESWDTSNWQNIEHIKSNDETAPEIQIIVYDTRTNHYHIFGTSDNVAAGFNKFAETLHTNYASVIDKVPYIGRDTAISNSYSYINFDNMSQLYDTYLKVNTTNKAVSTIEEPLNKNGFVCQKGSRLIFYVHAFDNIGFKDVPNQGVSSLEVKLVDCAAGNDDGETKTLTDGTYFENVFRQENYDKDGNLKSGMQPYKVLVTAKDNANPVNERKFELDIAVLGRTLDIRTLEEKRERIE